MVEAHTSTTLLPLMVSLGGVFLSEEILKEEKDRQKEAKKF